MDSQPTSDDEERPAPDAGRILPRLSPFARIRGGWLLKGPRPRTAERLQKQYEEMTQSLREVMEEKQGHPKGDDTD